MKSHPRVIRSTVEALPRQSTPAQWTRSTNTERVNIALNEKWRLMTGYMEATPLGQLNKAGRCKAPAAWALAHKHTERFKQAAE